MRHSGVYTVQLERRAEREMRNLPQHVISRIDVIFQQLENNPRPPEVVKLADKWVTVGEYVLGHIKYSIE